MRRIVDAGCGVIVYDRRHEGRGIGLIQKLKAYELQDGGLDTVEANISLGLPADARHYGTEAQILRDLDVESIRLLTNNPDKIEQLRRLGVVVEERIALEIDPSAHNAEYLTAKAEKMGHLINGGPEDERGGQSQRGSQDPGRDVPHERAT
jgi:3,4-dihydroxy 2-butanone 4-phosphate synthase/GTP cyclohydrolase II